MLDASKSVPVAGELISKETYDKFLLKTKDEYAKLRVDHANRKQIKNYLPFSQAKANKTKVDWEKKEFVTPKKLGNQVFKDYSIAEIRPYIDWTPFFNTWMLKGKYPAIFDNEIVGEEARKAI